MSESDDYAEAQKWLRLMRESAYKKEERALIEWIMAKIDDMRNS